MAQRLERRGARCASEAQALGRWHGYRHTLVLPRSPTLARATRWLMITAFPSILDHLLLVLIHPSGHRDEQKAKRIEDFFHQLFIIRRRP